MKYLLFSALLASVGMPQSLLAQTPDHRTQLSMALGTLKYNAKERSSSGAVINEESGSLPWVQLGVRHAFTPAYFVDASWRYAANTINYAGFTQLGIPLNTQTKLAWHQMSFGLGYRYPFSEAQSLEATLGLGQRRLDRAIQASIGSLPLREVLGTTQLQLGATWQQHLSARSQWHAGIALHQALRQSLAVDSFGLYDPITLRPAKQLDMRVHAGIGASQQMLGWITSNPVQVRQRFGEKTACPRPVCAILAARSEPWITAWCYLRTSE
jgi:hypothetical protein